MIYLDLVFNLTLLIAISIVSGYIYSHRSRLGILGALLQGLLFGGAALIGMLRPLNFGPGLIFDGRSVMISLAALFYGPLPAAIAVTMTGICRVWLGGSGMFMGLAVIACSGAAGLVFRKLTRPQDIAPSSGTLYLFGLTVHLLMVACMVLLPANMILSVMRKMAPPILLLYPLATVLAGKILSDLVRSQTTMNALRQSEQKFHDAIQFLPSPMCIAQGDGKITFINRQFTETYGYGAQDLPDIETWSRLAYPDAEYRNQKQQIWDEDVKNAIAANTNTPDRVYAVTCKDGSVRQVNISMRPLGNLFLTIFEDISKQRQLEDMLKRKVKELATTQEATISSMAILSEFRDTDTGSHIQRTKLYVKLMLEKMGDRLPYPPETIELIWHSAPLHDIGKVAIPDSILLKPGKLTPEEFEEMKKHSLYGSGAIKRTQELLAENSFLNFAAEIAEFHHEKWDGSGYPHGLSGEAIPLSARIMAIADVYDACIAERPYKEPIAHNDVVKTMLAGSGSHFDPELIGIFEANHEEFHRIANRYKDFNVL